MTPAIGSLLIIVVLAVVYAIDKLPPAVVAISAAVVCALCGMISYEDVFSALGGTSAVLLMSMMIVGGALFHTGLAAKIAEFFLRFTGTSERGIMVAVTLVTAMISSVLNNVGVVVTLMPIVLKMCKDAKVSPSRGLMPLAYGAGVGGIITLVGAASSVTANGIMEASGVEGLSFIELAWVGIPLSVLSILYIALFGQKLIPDNGFDFSTMELYNKEESETSVTKQWICGIIFALVIIFMAY